MSTRPQERSRSDPRGDGLRAGRRAARARGHGFRGSGHSALDPGYCAAVDKQQARGNANHLDCASRRNGPGNNRRRGGARSRGQPRSARRPRGIAFEAPAIRLLVAAGVASPFACDADEAPPWESVVAADVVADAIRCPICLEDEARAPVVTRCGHGFCGGVSCATVRLTTSAAGSARAAPRRSACATCGPRF